MPKPLASAPARRLKPIVLSRAASNYHNRHNGLPRPMTKAAWLEWCERRARLGSPTEVDHLVALIASNPEPREVQGSLQQFTVFGVDDQVRCSVRVVVTEYEDDPCCPFVCDPDWEIQLKVELLADPTGLAPTMASPWIELDRCTNCAQTSVDAPCWVANWDRRDGEVVGYLSRAKTVEIVTALLHEKSRLPNRAGILNWVMYSSNIFTSYIRKHVRELPEGYTNDDVQAIVQEAEVYWKDMVLGVGL